MPGYLLFRLHGALASWGDIAVGERRPSHGAPTKSAVFGLVAGALGLRRDDSDALAQLNGGYGFASRVDRAGELVSDFHTAQTAPANVLKGRHVQTRRDELTVDDRHDLKTILSQREYRCDAWATACLWPVGDSARWSLEELQSALRRPVFVPYLGRKSCPVDLPLAPVIVTADHPVDALKQAAPDQEYGRMTRMDAGVMYRWEGPDDARRQQTVERRDAVAHRGRWQFTDRREHVRVEPREG